MKLNVFGIHSIYVPVQLNSSTQEGIDGMRRVPDRGDHPYKTVLILPMLHQYGTASALLEVSHVTKKM